MALTGKFIADFSDFKTAVDQSIVQLRGFETGASKVGASLNRMTDQFSGRQVISQATLMVEAVDRVGGTSKLTAIELARVTTTANEAAKKMVAIGIEVPPGIQKIADGFRDVHEPVEGLGSRITGLVAAAAAARAAIQGVVTIGKEWVTAAGEQENASVRLNTALRAQGTITPGLIAQYGALSTQFERTTSFSDELLTEMQALLVTVGGVLPRDMKAALTASTDLAAALRIDLRSATELVAKAIEGNTGALKRHGIVIDETAVRTQGATVVFEAIAAKMGGAATDQAATFSGEMSRLGNVINNTEERLGGFIARALDPAIDKFLSLPEPVREGVVSFGLLATAAGATAAAVAALGAAVALAAPLLGFTAAGAGAAALGALGTAAGAAAAAFWPLSAAIASVWAAWKIGNIESVKNAIAEWALSSNNLTAQLYRAVGGIDQMSEAAATAAVRATAAAEKAAEAAGGFQALAESIRLVSSHTTSGNAAQASYVEQLAKVKAEVAALTPETVKQILAAKALGVSTDDLKSKFQLGDAALRMVTEGTKAATKANEDLAKSQRALANYIGEQQMAFIAADMKAAAAEVDSALTQMREDFIRVTAGDAKLLASEVGSVVDAMVADLARANAAMTADAKAMADEINAAMGAANRIPKLTTDTDAWAVSVNALSRQFEQLANIAGDSFGGFARWAGTVTASLGLASESTKQWSAGLAQFKSGDYTAGFAAMGSSIMGIASSFMAATNSSSAFQNTLGSAALGAQYGAQFGGPWGAAIGSVIGGLAGLMKSVFGGPSAAEMAGREAAEQYRAELEKTLTATQKLEAGNEAWKKSIIAIRDAYLANGATQAEAMAASERLWAAEKKGPEAVKAEIEKISAAMSNYTAATAAIEEFTAKNASFAQANLEVSLEAIEKERLARLKMITGIGPLMDEARRLIDDFYNHERDIALETMDTIEDRMRRKGYMTRAELQKEADAAVRAYDQMLASGLYTADVLQRAYKDAMDKIDAAIGNTAAKAKDFADKMKYYDRGFGQTGQDARSISPEQAQAMIDRFVQTGGTAGFAEDFLASNPGDEHRLESAYASSRDNQEAQLTAAQMAGSQGRDEFASGTHGQYLDFGTGKEVRLHGRERVMNEAEGKAESGAWSGMAVRLASIERMLERMLKDQPRQIRDAILTAR